MHTKIYRTTVLFGLLGAACLCVCLGILITLCMRFERMEQENAVVAHTLAVALEKYERVLRAIEKRQSSLEVAFITSEQLHLTNEQLRAYNRFRVTQYVFAHAEASSVPLAQGGD